MSACHLLAHHVTYLLRLDATTPTPIDSIRILLERVSATTASGSRSPDSLGGRKLIDAYLALVSLRVVREYADQPIGEHELTRILEAGRTTGSSQNRQMWRFHVLRDAARRRVLSETVYAPENVSGCQVVIALVSLAKSAFDIGRVAQNMMLAAWTEGIGSAPNGVRDMEAAKEQLGIGAEETLVTILSLGYPLRPLRPRPGGEAGVLARINRKPLDEVVFQVDER